MKSVLLIWFFVRCLSAQATTYYFSSTTGDDKYSTQQAKSARHPWRTLEKLRQITGGLQPGDSILFKRGDVFEGSIQLNISGTKEKPIVLTAYGSGADPLISGFREINQFSNTGGNIWEAAVGGSVADITSVRIGRSIVPMGRYPSATSRNSGYLSIASLPAANSITEQQPTGLNWTGAELVIRKNHWVLDKAEVLSHKNAELVYSEQSNYKTSIQSGYFLRNHRNALLNAGDWYFDRRRARLGILMHPGKKPAAVSGAVVPVLLTMSSGKNLVVSGLAFEGATVKAISITGCDRVQIIDCSISQSGNRAIYSSNSSHLTLRGLSIDRSDNTALDLSNTSDLMVKDCLIRNSGIEPGAGEGNSGSYEAMLLSGDRQLIEFNRIINTGYNPIGFSGNEIVIRNNLIDSFGLVKDDGGGIYTWNNGDAAPIHSKRFIECNIIMHGLGAAAGTGDSRGMMNGIYIDDNADHVSVLDNSVAGCSQYGLYVHNARQLDILRNTFYGNSQAQAALIHDGLAGPVRMIRLLSNVLVSTGRDQPVAVLRTIGNDLNQMGTIDSNVYYNPFNRDNPLTASWREGWSWHDLESWRAATGYDSHSMSPEISWQSYTINNNGREIFSNKFSNGQGDLYAFADAGTPSLGIMETGPLEGKQLRIAFNTASPSAKKVTIIARAGALNMGDYYLLHFDAAGIPAGSIEAYLRKSKEPYTDLSERLQCRINKTGSGFDLLFRAEHADPDASIAFDLPVQMLPVFLDNIRLSLVKVTFNPLEQMMRFIPNYSPAVLWPDNSDGFSSLDNKKYKGRVEPYRSVVLIKQPIK